MICLGRIWWKLLNHNFGEKKIFWKHVNDVFLVTDEFWIKWFFQKNVIFCPKNAFFWEKWLFHLELSYAQHRCQGIFFSGGNFTPIFEAKKLRKVEEKCPGHLTSLQFSPKSAIFWKFEKKVSESDWNQRHIVYVTQIHYYTWF